MKIVSRSPDDNQKRNCKLKVSPSQKENINYTGQKYYSLLKQKRNSTKKRTECKVFKRKDNKNIMTTISTKENKSFSKKSSPVTKIINHSFTKVQQIHLDKNMKQFISKTPKHEKQKIEFKKKNNLQKSKLEKQKNWFRSPPLAQKNFQNQYPTFNSTGKLQVKKEKASKQNNLQQSNMIISTIDNIKVNNFCFEHPKKQSKFYTQKVLKIQIEKNQFIELNQGMCQKCSNTYKKNGIDVFPIIDKHKQIRKEKIQQFMEQLQEVQQFCSKNEQVIRDKYQELNSNYEKQIEKLNDYFTMIYQHLEKQRNFMAENLEKTILKNKEQFETLLENYDEGQNILSQISVDIEQHYSNIIDKLDMEPFKKILNKYTDKLNFYKKLNESQNEIECKNAEINILKTPKEIIKQLNLKIDLITSSQTVQLYENNNLCDLRSESILESGIIEPKNLDKSQKLKSEVYISFDDKFQEMSQFESKENQKENDISQKYSQILQKINNSQKSKTEFYQNILKNNSQHFDSDIQLQPEDLNSTSQDKEELTSQEQEAIFELNKDDQESWIMKQTPDLRQKVEVPQYVENNLDRIKNNYINQKISKNINENLQRQKSPFSCQKTLF